MLKNIVLLKGKLLKKTKIRDNFSTITIMTSDYKPEKKNYPRLTCKTVAVNKELENLNIGDYVEITASIGDRKLFEGDKVRTVGCLYVNSIKKMPSLAESFGFILDSNVSSGRGFQNEFNLIGFLEHSFVKNGKTYIILSTPKRIVLVDYNPRRDYSNLKKGTLLCIKGSVQAGTRILSSATDEKEPSPEVTSTEETTTSRKYTESYVVSESDAISTEGFFRE